MEIIEDCLVEGRRTGIDENTIGFLYEGSQADLVFQKFKLTELLKN